MLQKKQAGLPATVKTFPPPRNVVNLFDALRASVAGAKASAPPPSQKAAAAKPGKKAAKRNPISASCCCRSPVRARAPRRRRKSPPRRPGSARRDSFEIAARERAALVEVRARKSHEAVLASAAGRRILSAQNCRPH